jgi:hypothetical protein
LGLLVNEKWAFGNRRIGPGFLRRCPLTPDKNEVGADEFQAETLDSGPANHLSIFHHEIHFAQGFDVFERIGRERDQVGGLADRNRTALIGKTK